jgi:hypothetical protein
MNTESAMRELNRRGSHAGDLVISHAARKRLDEAAPLVPLGVRFAKHDPGELHIPEPPTLQTQPAVGAADRSASKVKGLAFFKQAARKVVSINVLTGGGPKLSQSHGLESLRSTRRASLVDSLRKTYDTRDGLSAEEMKDTDQFYSDQALLKRDSMRFNPAIRRALDKTFEVVDTSGNGFVERHEYVLLCCKVNDRLITANFHEMRLITANSVLQLYLCIRAFWDPNLPKLNPTDLHELSARDWSRDAHGRTKMGKKQFCYALFQLCDLWTDTIEERQYTAFLELLLRRLTKLRDNGRRVYRDDRWARQRSAVFTARSILTHKLPCILVFFQ